MISEALQGVYLISIVCNGASALIAGLLGITHPKTPWRNGDLSTWFKTAFDCAHPIAVGAYIATIVVAAITAPDLIRHPAYPFAQSCLAALLTPAALVYARRLQLGARLRRIIFSSNTPAP